MDVVNSEIKQIGGSMEIETETGVGTRFTVRIPFSLAVMQAIGVSVGDRLFQIPLNAVAGVARVSPSDYQALAASESPVYEFAGEQFPLFDLEPLLDAPPLPLDSDSVSLLMIRAGDRTAAFRVNPACRDTRKWSSSRLDRRSAVSPAFSAAPLPVTARSC